MKDEKSGLELNDKNIQSQDSKVDNSQASSKTVETETNVDLSTIDFENTNLELFKLPITIENDKEKRIQNALGISKVKDETANIPEKINLENTNLELFELPIIIDKNQESKEENTIQIKNVEEEILKESTINNETTHIQTTEENTKEDITVQDTILIKSNIEEKTVELPIEKEEFINVPIIEVPNESIDNKENKLNNNLSPITTEPIIEQVDVQNENNITIQAESSILPSKNSTIDNQVSTTNIKTTKGNYYIGYKLRLVVFIGMFLILLIMLLISLQNTFNLSSSTKINYEENSSLDYKVYLKTNEFYDEEYLGKDKVYVASLIDKIMIDFQYNFNIEKESDIDFDYDIVAKLTINDNVSNKSYFEKDYILESTKKESIKESTSYNMTEQIKIDYSYYNNLANKFKQQYGIDAISNLTIYLQVNKQNDEDSLLNSPENSTMYLKIPLTQKAIDIELNYKDINNSSYILKTNESITDNVVFGVISIIIGIITIIVGVKLFKLLSMLTTNKSYYDKYIEKVLNEYDRFIVETKTGPNLKESNVIKISNFEELLDLRENIKLPIMYYIITNHTKSYFYIKHNNDLYLLTIKAVDLEEENK